MPLGGISPSQISRCRWRTTTATAIQTSQLPSPQVTRRRTLRTSRSAAAVALRQLLRSNRRHHPATRFLLSCRSAQPDLSAGHSIQDRRLAAAAGGRQRERHDVRSAEQPRRCSPFEHRIRFLGPQSLLLPALRRCWPHLCRRPEQRRQHRFHPQRTKRPGGSGLSRKRRRHLPVSRPLYLRQRRLVAAAARSRWRRHARPRHHRYHRQRRSLPRRRGRNLRLHAARPLGQHSGHRPTAAHRSRPEQ